MIPVLSFDQGDGRAVVNLDQLIRGRLLIQAQSGGGKSWALRSILEQTHGRIQQFVFDPEGEFASLRERYDYVLVGADGDIPAHPENARALCRRLMELGVSAVIDLYDLPITERQTFVAQFLRELMSLPRDLWRPLLVAIDEAQAFAPERGQGESEALGDIITLCTQGRKRGFAAVLATQRLSKLDKSVADVQNKLIGRTGTDVDVKRALYELGFAAERRNDLKKLPPGRFFAFGPAISHEVTEVQTGPILTTHPEAGKVAAYAPPPATSAIAALLEQLADIPDDAESDEDAEALCTRVRDLEIQLAEARAARPAPERVEVPVLTNDQTAALNAFTECLRTVSKDAAAIADEISGPLQRIAYPLVPADEMSAAAWVATSPIAVATTGASRPSAPAGATVDAASHGLKPPQARILNVLAGLAALGQRRIDKKIVAALAGQSHTSSAYGVNLKTLREAGLVANAGAEIFITDAGIAAADAPAPIRSLADLHAAWLKRFDGSTRTMLAAVIQAHPRTVHKDELADAAGHSRTSSSVGAKLGELRTYGLIDIHRGGDVAATKLLFPEGLS